MTTTVILERIRRGELTPEEGMRLIAAARAVSSSIALSEQATRHDNAADIAVIGMAGRFPGASNLDVFWEKLAAGEDCIGPIPATRWDADRYFDPDPKTPNKTYCKWGGFVPDSDCFDPLFFNISPREAELMDPQQRLFLEEAWRAIEYAGYDPLSLSGSKCGVYAGVMQGDYSQSVKSSVPSLDAQFIAGSGNCFLPARVSYFLNLTGPCISVDTACSSSLVAIHQACQAIANGEIDLALAGGVCVIATPYHHITSAKSEMLSPEGRCKSFDNSANGFIPTEGVGVVVLKPLRHALRDRDQIFGVIKGSCVNQDGKTNGITAPSARSQCELEVDVYKKYGIDPTDITYVEAHGTGTKLGDPIELRALTRAFRQFTDESGFCAIGSVKTNIGHALAAAGVAGLIKVLLSMRHGMLAPSLHFNQPNEHIEFDTSPFRVNTTARPWQRRKGKPRMAAISSFGLSGTNCHMVVAEVMPVARARFSGQSEQWAWLVPISARSEQQLEQRIADLAAFCEQQEEAANIGDVAYTLSVGRSHFRHRVACIVHDLRELAQVLRAWLRGEPASGLLPRHGADAQSAPEAPAGLAGMAQRYVTGEGIEWPSLYAELDVRRIALPAYPFARERYWLSDVSSMEADENGAAGRESLHPLLGCNVSTLREQRFVTQLRADAFYLRDHVVAGVKTLPGVCALEMARIAGEVASESSVTALRNVLWVAPIVVTRPAQAGITLMPNGPAIDFQVDEVIGAQRVLHAQGRIGTDASAWQSAPMDVAAIKKRCTYQANGSELYRLFAESGLHYGPSFSLIQTLQGNGNEAFSRIEWTADMADRFPSWVLHPAILDAVLQTVAGVGMGQSRAARRDYLPFGLGCIEWKRALPRAGFAHVRRITSPTGDNLLRFDVDFADLSGEIVLRCREFSLRAREGSMQEDASSDIDLMRILQRIESGELGVDEAESLLSE